MNRIVLVLLIGLPCFMAIRPTSYTVSHPRIFSDSNSYSNNNNNNEILNQEASVDSIITSYNNNHFSSNNHVSLLNGGDHLTDDGLSEGRILNGKKFLFGPNFLQSGLYKDDSCSVNKYALEHEGIIRYDEHMAKLDQFTLCTWMRFTKHDGDHVLFTYAAEEEPREIQFWVANMNNSSFISMAVHGQTLYRLNYPLLMKKWHHACTSWNGKTGEWQLWVKSERVGRGFHNRLVGYKIQQGGNMFSGGKSLTGKIAEGLHMEITWVQLYKVALSAGKAHRDHKHHHVHQFDHNGPISTTRAPVTAAPVVNQPVNPLLANGQIINRFKINLAGPQPQQPAPPIQGLPAQLISGQQDAQITTQFVRGQFNTAGRFLQEQLLGLQSRPVGIPPQSVPRTFNDNNAVVFPPSSNDPIPPVQITGGLQSTSFSSVSAPFTSTYSGFGSSPANVQIIDETIPSSQSSRNLFKRDQTKIQRNSKKVNKRELVMLTDGSVVDDKFFDTNWYDGIAQFGSNDLKNKLSIKRDNLEDEIKEHDREPAEGEVMAVMNYCSKCLVEPFQTALVLGWKEVTVSVNQGLRGQTATVCGEF